MQNRAVDSVAVIGIAINCGAQFDTMLSNLYCSICVCSALGANRGGEGH